MPTLVNGQAQGAGPQAANADADESCAIGRAIQLVSVQDGKLCIHEEAAEFLRSVKEPACVIAVVGLSRTGKSSLLNRILLQRSTGFSVGASYRACTKGLWIWDTVVISRRPDGSETRFILLDSEGLDANDADEEQDAMLFALVMLLSSYLIYNSVGAIDEGSLEQISLVTRLSHHIQAQAAAGGSEGDEGLSALAPYAPHFLWLLRDFALRLTSVEGEEISAPQYLDAALAPTPGLGPREGRNRIRTAIAEAFSARDCFALVRPVTDEAKLANLSTVQDADIRPAFLEQADVLRARILEHARPKSVGGQGADGRALLTLAECFAAAANSGAVPSIQGAFQRVREDRLESALAAVTALVLPPRESDEGAEERADADDAAAAALAVGDEEEERRGVAQEAAGRGALLAHPAVQGCEVGADDWLEGALSRLSEAAAEARRREHAQNTARGKAALRAEYEAMQEARAKGGAVGSAAAGAGSGSLPELLSTLAQLRGKMVGAVSSQALSAFLEETLRGAVARLGARDADAARRAEARAAEALEAANAARTQLQILQDREWKLKEHWEVEAARGKERSAAAEQEEARLADEIRRLGGLVAVGERELERRDAQVAELRRELGAFRAEPPRGLCVRAVAVTLAPAPPLTPSPWRTPESTERRSKELSFELEATLRGLADAKAAAEGGARELAVARQAAEDAGRRAREDAGDALRRAEEEIATQRAAAQAAQRDMLAAEKAAARLEALLAARDERVAELRAEIGEMARSLESARDGAHGGVQEAEKEWRGKLAEAQADHRRRLAQVEAANENALSVVKDTLGAERDALAARVASLEAAAAETQEEVAALRRQAEATSAEYEAAIDELEREQQQALAREREAARLELAGARAESAALVGKIEQLGEKVAGAVRERNASDVGVDGGVVESMSKVLAQKAAEMENLQGTSDETLARLRQTVEDKDAENEELRRWRTLFTQHCLRVQCRYCGRDVEAAAAQAHIPACMRRRGVPGAARAAPHQDSDAPAGQEWRVAVERVGSVEVDGQTKTVYDIGVARGAACWVVSRRYRDVARLHSQLRQRLPNVRLPDLGGTAKSSAARLFQGREDLVDQRRVQIGKYLSELLAIAVTPHTPELIAFLSLDGV